MNKISKKEINFNADIYNGSHYFYITSDRFWEGGYPKDANLSEKYEFYKLTTAFSDTLKEIIKKLNDKAIISKHCCQKGRFYEKWKDVRQHDSYNNLHELIKENKNYVLDMQQDDFIIDYIIENNFRYLSCIDLFLQKTRIVFQPTCHTEIIVYANDAIGYHKAKKMAEDISKHNQLMLMQYDGENLQ